MVDSTLDILMATYNGERYVREQVASIQGQSFQSWCLKVSDDCSSDGTTEIVKRLAEGDSRIELVGEGVRRGGAKENFAYLMSISTAPYVAFSDQDDIWLPDKLEKLMDAMHELEDQANPDEPLLVFSDAKVVTGDLDLLSPSFTSYSRLDPERISFSRLLPENYAPGFLILCNRQLINLAGTTLDVAGVYMHDWWLMLCAAAFGRIRFVGESLALYRQHGDNAVGVQRSKLIERLLLSHIDCMDRNFNISLVQATAFRDAYAERLSPYDRRAVSQYASMATGGPAENVLHLFRSGAWKKGERKVAQVITAVRKGSARGHTDA